MSNLKKNGQQMKTGEIIGANCMDQKKSQILTPCSDEEEPESCLET